MRFALINLLCVFLSYPIQAAPSLTGGTEHTAANPDGRFLIKVQLWGRAGGSGIHNVPDNMKLIDFVGHAGGITGNAAKTEILINRQASAKPSQIKIQADELLTNPAFANLKLAPHDVIQMNTETEGPDFWTVLGKFTTVLGVIATSASVYLLLKRN